MIDFDEPIDRRDSNCMKWDMMETVCGVSPDDGLAMWVADMDFRPPPAVTQALEQEIAHGVHGYFGDDRAYRAAITGWMARRHGWTVDPASIFSVHGLVAGTALCVQAYTEPGDGVVLFTPVYHAFARIIRANGRTIVESPLVLRKGRYTMDLEALARDLPERARLVILCSPHNPGGRVWSVEELRALAAFCAERDLILVSDEIHHDLVLPGSRHMVMPLAAPEASDRLVMLTAPSKSFNLAGGMTGNVIVEDQALRAKFAAAQMAAGSSPNRFGVLMATAAYARGDAWMDALCGYIAGNARVFDEGVAVIPGLRSMPLEATYLAWVDFSGTGMEPTEITRRVTSDARIATNAGPTFGTGGAGYLRFNLGTPRARVREAVDRLQTAFADLQ